VTATALLQDFDFNSLYEAGPTRGDAIEFRAKIRATRWLTEISEHRWEDIKPDDQEKLIDLAYFITKPSTWFGSVCKRLILAGIDLIDPELARAYHVHTEALDNLADVVLHQIERHDESFQAEIAQAIAEALAEGDAIESLDINNAEEWLNALSREAHSEV
jgi:hypothetical protein